MMVVKKISLLKNTDVLNHNILPTVDEQIH